MAFRRHFSLERVAPGVHAAVAEETGAALSNVGIVDLGGATVVFDATLTPTGAEAVVRAAERLTGRTPTWVVNSHYHGDHIWGNSSFVDGHVVSSTGVRRAVLARSRAQLDACRREFPAALATLDAPDSPIAPRDRPQVRAWYEAALALPRSHRIVPPEVTFPDELVLEGTRRSLRLITYGGGHSPSDVFGYLEDERILFAGDLVLVGYHLSAGDGWPDRWRRILDRMRRLKVDRLLPGHGPIGRANAIDRARGYLADLERTVAGVTRRGGSAADVARLSIPERYRGLGFSMMYRENLLRTYRLHRSRRPARLPSRRRRGSFK
ncbi:MAG: MBL fold metallo-hydrolase [Thermoplasmata archaeon]